MPFYVEGRKKEERSKAVTLRKHSYNLKTITFILQYLHPFTMLLLWRQMQLPISSLPLKNADTRYN